MKQRIAVLIPAYNEMLTVGKVVKDFKKALPEATIYVLDNNSTDGTGELAKKAGATVVLVRKPGKGNVVQYALDEIDADYYLMVDGDDTYPAEAARGLLAPVMEGKCDMVVGSRLQGFKKEKKRAMHKIGNQIILWALYFCFPTSIKDMLSGYRAMNRDLVKSLNLLSTGFTIETEITIKALEQNFKIRELPIDYRERPKGSVSKLDSWEDGIYILTTVLELFRDHRPMQFFIAISIIPFALAVGFGYGVIEEVVAFGNIQNIGNLIIANLFGLITLILLSMGFIASSVRKSHVEMVNLLKKVKSKQQ